MTGAVQATTARRALVCLDLTNLEDDCNEAAVDALCRRAQTRHGSVAAVCVWPRFVAQAKAALARTGIRVATVVNFPTGEEPLDAVAAAVRTALADGVDEIDLVVPWRRHAAGETEAVSTCVRAVKAVCGPATLKAILETGELADPAFIATAAEAALEGGADFLKTSTGKLPQGATPEAAELLLEAIGRSGRSPGLKVSGGVRSVADAGVYISICDRVMGASWAGPKHFRIGASGLLGAVLSTLEGEGGSDAGNGY